MIKVLTKLEEFISTINEEENVLVDFNAKWCGPCRMMSRVIEDLEEEKDMGITFLKVDTDDFPEIAQKFGVLSIPTMVAFKKGKRIPVTIDGKKEEVLMGARSMDEFEKILKKTFSE